MGVWFAGVVVVGGALLGVSAVRAAPAAQAAFGTEPGAVTLNPASGASSGKPTWSTSTACPAGFRGSAIFREVHADGTTTNSISQAVTKVTAPFSGTLQADIAQIQAAGGIPNGGTQELVIICFSGPSLTGTSHPEMDTFITYAGNGASYASRGNASPSPSSSPSPGSSLSPSGSRSSSPGGTGPGSGSTSSGTASPSSSVSPAPASSASPASPAPSPTPVNSSLAVTG